MHRFKKFKALTRACAVVGLVLTIAGGLTFAALQSQQDTLSGNTIKTANANMLLSVDGANYSNSQPGYDFNNLIPGGAAMPLTGYSVYLKNTGATALGLKLAISSAPSNPNNVDLSKVNLLLTTVGSGSGTQSFSLASLIAAAASGGLDITSGNLASGMSQQYKLQISMASDSLTASSATLGNIDLAFNGLAVTN